MRQVQVVVLDECHPPFELGIAREAVYRAQNLLPRRVRRVRLTGENELHRTRAVHQQGAQPLGIGKYQVGTLVRRESPRKPNREGVGIEQRSRAHHVRGFLPVARPTTPRFLAHEVHEIGLEREMHAPESCIVKLHHLFPEGGILYPVPPVMAKVMVEEVHHFA